MGGIVNLRDQKVRQTADIDQAILESNFCAAEKQ